MLSCGAKVICFTFFPVSSYLIHLKTEDYEPSAEQDNSHAVLNCSN
jgi:hypothetical protein